MSPLLSFRIVFRPFLALLLLVLAGHSTAAKEESPQLLMTALYAGSISGWDIELERTLTQYPDGHYRLRSYADKLFAFIEETSTFTLKDGLIQPQEYTYKRSVFGKKTVERIVYNWAEGQAQYTRSDRKKNNTKHKLTPATLDPALYQLALQADLAKGQDGLLYDFIKRKRTEQYHLKTIEEESLSLSGRSLKATVVLRKDPDSDKTTKVWVAPELNHVIAKIHHTDKDGDEFQITLKDLRVNAQLLDDFYRAFSNNKQAQ